MGYAHSCFILKRRWPWPRRKWLSSAQICQILCQTHLTCSNTWKCLENRLLPFQIYRWKYLNTKIVLFMILRFVLSPWYHVCFLGNCSPSALIFIFICSFFISFVMLSHLPAVTMALADRVTYSTYDLKEIGLMYDLMFHVKTLVTQSMTLLHFQSVPWTFLCHLWVLPEISLHCS